MLPLKYFELKSSFAPPTKNNYAPKQDVKYIEKKWFKAQISCENYLKNSQKIARSFP